MQQINYITVDKKNQAIYEKMINYLIENYIKCLIRIRKR